MSSLRLQYGATTGITISLASLTNGGARQSLVVDNTGNLFIDVLVQVKIKLVAGSPASEKSIYVYAYGSEDGTDLTDNASGLDASITLRQPSNLHYLGVINTPDAGGLAYVSHPMSLQRAFGGFALPRKWGIAIYNQSGLAFSGTEGDHRKAYTGVHFQTV